MMDCHRVVAVCAVNEEGVAAEAGSLGSVARVDHGESAREVAVRSVGRRDYAGTEGRWGSAAGQPVENPTDVDRIEEVVVPKDRSRSCVVSHAWACEEAHHAEEEARSAELADVVHKVGTQVQLVEQDVRSAIQGRWQKVEVDSAYVALPKAPAEMAEDHAHKSLAEGAAPLEQVCRSTGPTWSTSAGVMQNASVLQHAEQEPPRAVA